jgi:hypothetical protein
VRYNKRPVSTETLRTFIWYNAGKGDCYATVFAKACEPFGDEKNFEENFDYLWEQYGLRTLRN